MNICKYIKLCFNYFRIPKGDYCYNIKKVIENADGTTFLKTVPCPYFEKIDNLPSQEDGYCHWLERGDHDRNNDENIIFQQIDNTGKVIGETTAPEMPFGISLLWDGVKECNLRHYSEKEEIQMWEKDEDRHSQ